MLLYHGSNMAVAEIDLNLCRPYKDFGKGFYLTIYPEQALQMATRVSRLYGGTSVVSMYEFAESAALDLVVRQFADNIISLEALAQGMEYRKLTNQYSFHTVQAIKALTFKGVMDDKN